MDKENIQYLSDFLFVMLSLCFWWFNTLPCWCCHYLFFHTFTLISRRWCDNGENTNSQKKHSKKANFKSFIVGVQSQRWSVWDHWVMLCFKTLSGKSQHHPDLPIPRSVLHAMYTVCMYLNCVWFLHQRGFLPLLPYCSVSNQCTSHDCIPGRWWVGYASSNTWKNVQVWVSPDRGSTHWGSPTAFILLWPWAAEGSVQHTGPLLVSCVHYSVAGESSPFLLLSASCSLEIAKVAAKPECKSEPCAAIFSPFLPDLPELVAWTTGGVHPGHRVPAPGPGCWFCWAQPCLVFLALPASSRLQHPAGGSGTLLRAWGQSGRESHELSPGTPSPLLELGLHAALYPPRYVGLGSEFGGEPGGAGADWAAPSSLSLGFTHPLLS